MSERPEETTSLILNALEDDRAALTEVLAALESDGYVLEAVGDLREFSQLSGQRAADGSHRGVLTVWSRASILDEGVVAFAELALESDCLVPVRIDDVAPPIGFRQVQTHDIVRPTREAGQALGRAIQSELQGRSRVAGVGDKAFPVARHVAEWILFVVPAAVLYPQLLAMFGPASAYCYFMFAAGVIATATLVDVPRFLLRPGDPAASAQSLRCARIDLVFQAALAALLLFLEHLGALPGSAWRAAFLVTEYLCAAIGTLLLRYVVIGLWLARTTAGRPLDAILAWLAFLGPSAVTYAAGMRLAFGEFGIRLFCLFVAISAAQAIVFGIPGFEATAPQGAAKIRRRLPWSTGLDLFVQLVLCSLIGAVWHPDFPVTPTEAVLRGACLAWASVIVRDACVRGWLAHRRRRGGAPCPTPS